IAPLCGAAGISYGKDVRKGPWVTVNVVFADGQDDVPAESIPSVGWFVLNLKGGWIIRSDSYEHELHVGVENLFDRTYRDYMSTYRGNVYNELGRSLVLGYSVAI
ncbi:MAG: TonB-dependent receptor, partial [Lentisphaerae bacterium]|nr:TonB-dependent receptor [Lentisphaerota bacterium]